MYDQYEYMLLLLPLILLLLALGQNATMPTTDSLTGKVVPPNVRGKAYGLSFFFPMIAGSTAPLIGALILKSFNFNYTVIFLLTIGLYVLAALMTSLIRENSSSKNVPAISTGK